MLRRLTQLPIMLLTLFVAGCGASGDGTSRVSRSKTIELVTPGVLTVGTEPGYPPFEMTGTDGEIKGFDIDVVSGLADTLGLELKLMPTEFDGLIPSLQTRKIDLIASGMTITPERAEIVDFTNSYYEVGQVLLMRKELEQRVRLPADLNDSEFRIAVQTGTTGQFAAQEHMPLARLQFYESGQVAADAVLRGAADALVFDDPLVRIFAAEHPTRVTAVLEPFTQEELGFAVHKNNTKLLESVNTYLSAVRATGEIDKLAKKWFEDLSWKDR